MYHYRPSKSWMSAIKASSAPCGGHSRHLSLDTTMSPAKHLLFYSPNHCFKLQEQHRTSSLVFLISQKTCRGPGWPPNVRSVRSQGSGGPPVPSVGCNMGGVVSGYRAPSTRSPPMVLHPRRIELDKRGGHWLRGSLCMGRHRFGVNETATSHSSVFLPSRDDGLYYTENRRTKGRLRVPKEHRENWVISFCFFLARYAQFTDRHPQNIVLKLKVVCSTLTSYKPPCNLTPLLTVRLELTPTRATRGGRTDRERRRGNIVVLELMWRQLRVFQGNFVRRVGVDSSHAVGTVCISNRAGAFSKRLPLGL
ncbi:hypothetical protein DFH09DRAFT_1073462 [Mycena vulgaris]|nr:hypothetical protein DFH09DRAFT_1073462 [Mycena vulgaris]